MTNLDATMCCELCSGTVVNHSAEYIESVCESPTCHCHTTTVKQELTVRRDSRQTEKEEWEKTFDVMRDGNIMTASANTVWGFIQGLRITHGENEYRRGRNMAVDYIEKQQETMVFGELPPFLRYPPEVLESARQENL
jgi:hypothetical protein